MLGSIRQHKLAASLLAAYIVLFSVCAINPYDRGVWWAENLPIIFVVAIIICFYRYHRFSRISLLAMSVLVALHTIGGHYTFERVPFDYITDLFSFERNHYDRIAHFSVGFYAYPIAEILLAKRLVNSPVVLVLFPVFAIFAVAGSYEIFEWRFAVMADPVAGLTVLGSQGDIWDAQKDILADALGAVLAVFVFYWCHRAAISRLQLP